MGRRGANAIFGVTAGGFLGNFVAPYFACTGCSDGHSVLAWLLRTAKCAWVNGCVYGADMHQRVNMPP